MMSHAMRKPIFLHFVRMNQPAGSKKSNNTLFFLCMYEYERLQAKGGCMNMSICGLG